jgi:FAD/FMN-containing dehydrogenase
VLELEYCDDQGNLCRADRESPVFPDLLQSEGMYGVITGARLATTPVPGENWGLIFFLDSEDRAAEFASSIRNLPGVTALEYLDGACVQLLRTYGQGIAAVTRLPELPKQAFAAVYGELEAADEAQMEEFAEAVIMAAEEVGADPDLSWTAVGEEVERFRDLHHAVQECINLKTAENHGKDAAVTRLTFPVCAALGAERSQELKALGLETAVFGHWDAHLPLGIHIFAKDAAQYRLAKEIMARWYQEGAVVQPHRGIGKVYRDVFDTAFLRSRKAVYDPDGFFNPGNE